MQLRQLKANEIFFCFFFNQEGPILPPGLVNLSPPGGPTPLDARTALNVDFAPRRSPVQFPHSPPHYYCPEDNRKSESPSRKRRRLSRGPPAVDLPPSPPPARSHGPFTRSRGSPPMRRTRYWTPYSNFQQPPIPLMNVNQVCGFGELFPKAFRIDGGVFFLGARQPSHGDEPPSFVNVPGCGCSAISSASKHTPISWPAISTISTASSCFAFCGSSHQSSQCGFASALANTGRIRTRK